MDVRWVKPSRGKMILQKYTMVRTDRYGHAIFGWVNVDIVEEGLVEELLRLDKEPPEAVFDNADDMMAFLNAAPKRS